MKKRKILTAVWAVLVCVSLCSCQGTEGSGEGESSVSTIAGGETGDTRQPEEDRQTQEPEDTQQSKEDQQTSEPEIQQDTTEEQGTSAAEDAAFSYSQLGRFSFTFSSGAGAWSTDMVVYADGSFDGIYHDSDMGDTGEDHPNGTVYFCAFSGRFGELKKVDDFTYQTTIVEIQYENEPDTKEIVDGTLYQYTDAYGLEDAENILFYLPGTPAEALSEECRSWLRDVLYDWGTGEWLEELPCVALCNEAMGECFSGWDDVEEFLEWLPDLQKSVAESLAGLEQESDGEKRASMASESFMYCDATLNSLWDLFKRVLPAKEMEQLTEEQRLWIADKERQMEEAAAGVSDSTEAEVQSNIVGARLTLDRIEELVVRLESV